MSSTSSSDRTIEKHCGPFEPEYNPFVLREREDEDAAYELWEQRRSLVEAHA